LQALERLEALSTDYRNVDIPQDSLIYCDIPYSDTDCEGYGGGEFNHSDFYEWARAQDNIFISEYEMPSDFIEIASVQKLILCGVQNTAKATERLYTNEKTYSHMSDRQKRIIALNTAQQLTIMDFLGKEDT
jgi:DNA adenine methylase